MPIWLLACAGPDQPASISPEELEEFTTALTDLGPRMVGSPAEPEAAELIEGWLLELDPQVEVVPVVWDAWQPGPGRLSSPDGDWSLEALPWSPSPPASLQAPWAWLGEDVEGRIAVSRSSEIKRKKAYPEALEAGAIGLVQVHEYSDEGEDQVEMGHTQDGGEIPAAVVPAGALELIEASEELLLELDTLVLEGHESPIVEARVPGELPGLVYVLAHYDSWQLSPGAIDNALGVAMMVAMMRAHVEVDPGPRPTVVFLATSGEEQLAKGSTAWAELHDSEIREQGLAVITLDMPWGAEGRYLVQADQPELLELAVEATEQAGLKPRERDTVSPRSDHLPFVERGIPVTWSTLQLDPHYHTALDQLEYVDFEEAAQVAEMHRLLLAAVCEAASDAEGLP